MPWDKTKKTEGALLMEYAILSGIPSEKIFVTTNVAKYCRRGSGCKGTNKPK